MVVGLRLFHQNPLIVPQVQGLATKILPLGTLNVQCSAKPAATQYNNNEKYSLRTCKNCKTQYDPALNHPRSCRYHTAHFGGKYRSLLSFLLYFILIFFFAFFFFSISCIHMCARISRTHLNCLFVSLFAKRLLVHEMSVILLVRKCLYSL